MDASLSKDHFIPEGKGNEPIIFSIIKRFYTDKGVISLRMFNIQSGFIEFNGAKRVEVTDEELNRYSLNENDLLIN